VLASITEIGAAMAAGLQTVSASARKAAPAQRDMAKIASSKPPSTTLYHRRQGGLPGL
jgi:hypothetical protein